MATLTQPLRDEHKELYPEIETLRLAADGIDTVLCPAAREKIDQAYSFLAYHLLPHAQAEEKALYPVVQKVMGSPHGTATMSRDHAEVDRLTVELASLRDQIRSTTLTPEQVFSFRGLLYGLYALVKLHFAKEEEVYLPLLDSQLQPEEAQAMFTAMEHAAHAAKGVLHPA
jgi:iron-sulfur cluster repair protein YtfE (RIC family)